MNIEYRIEFFSNDNECWFDDGPRFSLLNGALEHLKRCADSHPDMAHRIVKIETIALTVNGETLITGA